MSTPLREDGFAMPAEWAPQSAVWLSWPTENGELWAASNKPIPAKFAEIAAAISRFEPVRINAPQIQHTNIRDLLNTARADLAVIEIFDHQHDDVWCRDHGPIFVKHRDTGALAITDWGFNGWGEKFTPFDLDNTIPEQIANTLKLPRYDAGMILEGGSIEINGRGQLLTTEAVLLNPNRNPQLSRDDIASRLRDYLAIDDILWLDRGIKGDDTDGHIDDLARFTDDDTIVAAIDHDTNSPNHAVLSENFTRLSEFKTASGRPFNLVGMPQPQACEVPGWRLPILPASYVNFLIINDAVIAPSFQQAKNDERAAGILGELFPGRKVVTIDCLDLVQEGGALHCISQQQPR